MIILPIGHDEMSVRRLPWVTIALALTCIAVQIRANVIEREAEGAIVEAKARLRALANEAFARRARELGRNPEALATSRGRHDLTRFPAFVDDDLREQIDAVKAKLAALHEKHPVQQFGYRPAKDGALRMLTCAFAHGGWLHLIGNLLILYFVGCNLEDRMGRWRYLVFYLAGAFCASAAFRLWHPNSMVAAVGASGAIAACMGAFSVYFYRARIRFFYWLFPFFRFGTFAAPAWVALLFWAVDQLLMSWLEASANLGVAYSAHLGGFSLGLAVALIARRLRGPAAADAAPDPEAPTAALSAAIEAANAAAAANAAGTKSPPPGPTSQPAHARTASGPATAVPAAFSSSSAMDPVAGAANPPVLFGASAYFAPPHFESGPPPAPSLERVPPSTFRATPPPVAPSTLPASAAPPGADLTAALASFDWGDHAEALRLLDLHLVAAPSDLPARAIAIRAAVLAHDEAGIARHLPPLFAAWSLAGEPDRIVETYQQLRTEAPARALPMNALVDAAAAARSVGAMSTVLDAAGEIAAYYPDSTLLPRVLWLAAEAQEQMGRPDHAHATLRGVLARFPTDPISILARRKLAAAEGGGDPF